jgi:hypothetical protein
MPSEQDHAARNQRRPASSATSLKNAREPMIRNTQRNGICVLATAAPRDMA